MATSMSREWRSTRSSGIGVDSSGLAGTWVLGMAGGGNTTLLSYSEGEWKSLDIPDPNLPDGEVKIDQLLSPQALFKQDYLPITREMTRLNVVEMRELTLDQNTYQVTIQSASDSSTLSFNAMTGELIS